MGSTNRPYPVILVFEDQIHDGIVKEINLSVYLGASVRLLSSYAAIAELGGELKEVDLILTRSGFDANNIAQLDSYLATLPAMPHIVSAGASVGAHPKAVAVPDDTRLILQQCARLLGITAKGMAQKELPPYFQIPARYLRYIVYFPCAIYTGDPEKNNLELLFQKSHINDHKRVDELEAKKTPLYIRSSTRLKFVNSFTEQVVKICKEMGDQGLRKDQKIKLFNVTMDVVVSSLQWSGINPEAFEMAKASIAAMEALALSYRNANTLVRDLIDDKASYRYMHSQLLVFVGFHVMRVLDWWNDELRADFAASAYFHDLSLSSDSQTRIFTERQVLEAKLMPEQQRRVRSHAFNCSKLLENFSELTERTRRIVREHHASVDGEGFAYGLGGLIDKLDPLSQVFVYGEQWIDYLILQNEGAETLSKDLTLQKIQENFSGSNSEDIVRALRYLDPSEFFKDFLLKPLAAAPDIDRQIDKILAGIEGLPQDVRQNWERMKAQVQALNNLARFGAQGLSPEEVTVVRSVTLVIKEEMTKVRDGLQLEETQSMDRRIQGVTDHIEEVVRVVKDNLNRMKKDTITKLEKLIGSTVPAGPGQGSRIGLGTEARNVSLLMMAAENGRADEVKALIADKKMLRQTDSDGRTCLHYAAIGGNLEILELLIASGLSKNTLDAKRRSPLFYAISGQHEAAIRFLIREGAIVTQQTLGGMNLGMVAAFQGDLPVLQLLLEKGLRLEAVDYKDRTLLDYAELGSQKEVLTWLQSLKKQRAA